jgi:hypothetical protein
MPHPRAPMVFELMCRDQRGCSIPFIVRPHHRHFRRRFLPVMVLLRSIRSSKISLLGNYFASARPGIDAARLQHRVYYLNAQKVQVIPSTLRSMRRLPQAHDHMDSTVLKNFFFMSTSLSRQPELPCYSKGHAPIPPENRFQPTEWCPRRGSHG